jgi:ubiquinone/menaquinone biosynthesis C-methylase UbiE
LVSVTEGYERWAPTYDHDPNPLLHLEERKLSPLLPRLENKHVLDLACGTGRWLEKIVARRAKRAVGVDSSAAMLCEAAKKPLLAGILARADAVSLPFGRAIFDLAICSFALGHFEDLTAVVRELARVMKPGSQVFVTDLHPQAYARGWRTGFRNGRNAIRVETLPRTSEEIIKGFHRGGFECLTHIPLCLGAAEEPTFERAGKRDEFSAA